MNRQVVRSVGRQTAADRAPIDNVTNAHDMREPTSVAPSYVAVPPAADPIRLLHEAEIDRRRAALGIRSK